MTDTEREKFIDKLTALSEAEMQLLRMMMDKPEGAILTVETDILVAQLLASEGMMTIDENNKVLIPEDVRRAFTEVWSDEVMLKWRKRNWMYKCLDAGVYLYGVMTWDALADLFALRYPNAPRSEIRELFEATPDFYRCFNEIDGKLVLNGYEKDDYYKYLEKDVQGDVPFYVPTKEQVEELFDRGSLISTESHAKLKDFIVETYGCDEASAEMRIHEIYEKINNRARVLDIADDFAAGDGSGIDYTFKTDEVQVKFLELLMEMSRDCRVRDNRGHDWYEMTAIMAKQNRGASGAGSGKGNQAVKRVKIGRNDPCPCGSGKKYKNCCGRN